MNRSNVITLLIGLLVCVLIGTSGVLVEKHLLSAAVAGVIDSFLAFSLLTVRSWIPAKKEGSDASN